MLNPETRASLILRLSDRDDDLAWAQFLEIYEPMLFQLASRWGLQEADAREVVQETLLAVVHSIDSYQPRSHERAFRGWLATITRRKLVDHLGTRDRQTQGTGDSRVHQWLDQQMGPGASASVWDWHVKQQVFRWASAGVRKQVSEQTWQAFYRTSIENEPIDSVASDLGIRPGMVYVARSRVMSRLRKLVEGWTRQQESER